MNPNKRLTQLVTLKHLNLNLIADLLNTPNADLRKLENAKDAQDYLNYQISLVKAQFIGESPMNSFPVSFPINSPIFQDSDEPSSFASFKPSNLSVNNSNTAAEWEFNAKQLLPKETGKDAAVSFLTLPERNKEEIIFKPSQEQLSGVVRLPEDNWVQTLPKITAVQQKIEPVQEQLTIAPIKCETVGLTTDSVKSAKFVRMPETATEIEQAVKRDLQYLQNNLDKSNVNDVTGITDPEIKEDIYTDPYSEYYN